MSGWARDDSPGYAIAALIAGTGLLIIAGALVKRVKVTPTSFDVEMRDLERDASARAADVEVEPADVAREIESQDQSAPAPSEQDPDVIGTLNYVAGNIALAGIIEWTTHEGSPLAGCELRLYLYDEELDRLVPILDPSRRPNHQATAWEVGKGATGAAYATGQYVLATGAAVSDGTYQLTPEQQERFRKLAAVAAAPIFNAAGDRIGVLTASTSDLSSRLATDDGLADHTLCALLVSRVLIELLQWFDDGSVG